MSKDLISIVIPIYNAEDRIKICLDSVINQSINNIEIVLINDGSTDRTKEIIETYDFKNIKHKIINKENEGVSKARNLGIMESTGDLITFLDADDTLTSSALEYASKLFRKGVDAVKTSYNLDYNGKKIPCYSVEDEKIYNKEEINNIILNLLIGKSNGFSSIIMVKRNILINNNVFYQENVKYMEDLIFIIRLLRNCNTIYVSKKITLNYYQSSNSISRSINIFKRIDGITNRYNSCIGYFNSKEYKDYKSVFINKIVEMYLKSQKYILNDKKNLIIINKKIINEIDKIINDNSEIKLSVSNKILVFFVKNNYRFIFLIINYFYEIYLRMKGVKYYD